MIVVGKRTCSLDDCDRPHFGLGLCRRHHSAARNAADPLRDKPCSRCKINPRRANHSWCFECHSTDQRRRSRARSADPAFRLRERERGRLRGEALKREAMDAYGGVCACCGEASLIFLAIDHVNNDGAAHRREVGIKTYQWLRNNGYPDGFQVLCHNCNFAKSHGGCPHLMEAAA